MKIRHKDYYLERDRAIVRLDSEVNQESILGLCDVIDLCVGYYHYQDITIQIDSPGGEADYLDFFAQKLATWRKTQRRLAVRTEALSKAGSAAAFILTLGDRRTAFSSTTILFHSARVVAKNTLLTAFSADKISQNIKNVDRKWIERIVARVIQTYRSAPHVDLDITSTVKCPRHRKAIADINRLLGDAQLSDDMLKKKLTEQYARMFERDEAIPAAVAHAYYLIDEVIQ